MTPRPGDRIRIVATDDEGLRLDAIYEVFHTDDFGHVWLNGTDAVLCPDLGDRWELIEETAA
jgi:hypothetical protein